MSKTLDFTSSTSKDRGILDFFTYNTAVAPATRRAGIVNLNTRNGPVLGSIIRGALLQDLGGKNPPTALALQPDALTAGQAIVRETTNTGLGHGSAFTRGDVPRLTAPPIAALPALATADEKKQTFARALAEIGQARIWNLMIDVIAQTGKYVPGTPELNDPSKLIVLGEQTVLAPYRA